jgi:hypothetical protein
VILARAANLGLSLLRRRPWSDEELDFLKSNAGQLSLKALAARLSRTYYSVKAAIRSMELDGRVTHGYSVDELVRTFEVGKATVDRWIAKGWVLVTKAESPKTPFFASSACDRTSTSFAVSMKSGSKRSSLPSATRPDELRTGRLQIPGFQPFSWRASILRVGRCSRKQLLQATSLDNILVPFQHLSILGGSHEEFASTFSKGSGVLKTQDFVPHCNRRGHCIDPTPLGSSKIDLCTVIATVRLDGRKLQIHRW